MRSRGIRICGSGMAVPRRKVTSDELDLQLGLAPGTVLRESGVACRYQATDETAADLAFEACNEALAAADLTWDDIDCVVAASATMDQSLPFNAALVLAHASSRARPIAAFDVGASCLSFLVALDTVAYAIDEGRYGHVLIVSADIATFALDWSSLRESAIFGDGAAAVVLRRSSADEASALVGARTRTLAEGVDLCRIEAGGSRFHPRRRPAGFESRTLFRMDGARLYRLILGQLPPFIDAFLTDVGMECSSFDLIVPHQASRLALDHLVRRLAFEPSKVVDIFSDFGNQVGASLPSALHHAITTSRIARGQSMMLVGTGAGVTLGAMALVY